MVKRIAVSLRAGQARIGLLEGSRLCEYTLWSPQTPDGVGDIYTARLVAKTPAMAGCFLDLGGMTGFLPDSAGGAKHHEGDIFTVLITRAAQSGKGPRLAASSQPPAAKPGLMLPGCGPLIELAQREAASLILIDDHALMAQLRPLLQARLSYQSQVFDTVLEDEIAGLADPLAALPQGARLHITPTPALTALDVDAGGASAENSAKPRAQLLLNMALIPEITRQILLRNLGGAILIDFAGMKPKSRLALAPALTAALAADPLKPRLLGFSHTGFAEISRPRIRPPLHELLA